MPPRRIVQLIFAALPVACFACGDNLPDHANAAPSFTGSALVTAEDTSVEITLDATDADGELLTFTLAQPAHGSVTTGRPPWRYSPAENFYGADSFEVTVSDAQQSVTATVAVTVTPVNDPPVASTVSASTEQGVPVEIALAGTDVEADALMFALHAAPAHGTVTITNSTATYTPSGGHHGNDQFEIKANDGSADSAPVVVAVTVIEVPGAPSVTPDGVTTTEDTPVSIAFATLLANDGDPDGDTLAVTDIGDVTPSSAGTIAEQADQVVFTPQPNFHGTATFSYTISDGTFSATGVVSVVVSSVNDPPTASPSSVTTSEDVAVVISLAAVDGDVEDTLGFAVVDQPTHGDVVIEGSTATYVPAAHYHGTDSFTFKANDGVADSSPVAVEVAIAAVNDPPVLVDDQGTVTQSSSIDIPVLANDSDIDGDSLAITQLSNMPAGASASIETPASGPPFIRFTAPAIAGNVSFSYQASDGTASGAATVTVTVQDAPSTCGNGKLQYAEGETCDDGNTTTGDGCSATCQYESPFATVAPVLVSGDLNCTTWFSNAGRKVAIDGIGNIYVVMNCEGSAYVAVSRDHGATYGAPIALGISDISEIAIAGGSPGHAYVAALSGGQVMFTRTTPLLGAAWEQPRTLGTSNDNELSLEAFNDEVYVGIGGGELPENESPLGVLRNTANGAGAFTSVLNTSTQMYFDLLYDDTDDKLLICTDTPELHLSVGTFSDVDGTRTLAFGSVHDHTDTVFYSDWAASSGVVFVAGIGDGDTTSTRLTWFRTNAPQTPHTLDGLPDSSQFQQRALTADPAGNAYVVTKLDDIVVAGDIRLDRVVRTEDVDHAPTFALTSPRAFTAAMAGSLDRLIAPGVTALPTSNGVAMVFTAQDASNTVNRVYATVQVY